MPSINVMLVTRPLLFGENLKSEYNVKFLFLWHFFYLRFNWKCFDFKHKRQLLSARNYRYLQVMHGPLERLLKLKVLRQNGTSISPFNALFRHVPLQFLSYLQYFKNNSKHCCSGTSTSDYIRPHVINHQKSYRTARLHSWQNRLMFCLNKLLDSQWWSLLFVDISDIKIIKWLFFHTNYWLYCFPPIHSLKASCYIH